MNNKSTTVGAEGLALGVVLSGSVSAYAVNGRHVGVMKAYAMDTSMMNDMTAALKNKTGDAFDKALMSEMITQHQVAIAMANLALTKAKHQEVKDLAKNIATAQTSEISQMQMWQAEWGYTTSSTRKDSMPSIGM
jgi:uncharacterized protein (DUF305 family)